MCKTMNLNSSCERDEKKPQRAGMQSVSVPSGTTVVPEEALKQDCTAGVSHGDGNLHHWVTAKTPSASASCSSFSLTTKIWSSSKSKHIQGVQDKSIHGHFVTTTAASAWRCRHHCQLAMAERALLGVLHLSLLGIHMHC